MNDASDLGPVALRLAEPLHPFAIRSSARDRGLGLKLVCSLQRISECLKFSFALAGRTPAEIDALALREFKPLSSAIKSEPGDVSSALAGDVSSNKSAAKARVRRDEIWKSTCLELFLAPEGSSEYIEMNLCPSGDWNVYAFDSYRQGHRQASDACELNAGLEVSPSGDLLVWHGELRADPSAPSDLSRILASPNLVIGATAVLEYKNGEHEYWALTHAGSKPDFHLRESFRLVL